MAWILFDPLLVEAEIFSLRKNEEYESVCVDVFMESASGPAIRSS